DVAVGRAADVERPHRQLRTRFADGLGGDDAHGESLFDLGTGRQVHAVAEPADAQFRFAGHGAADLDPLQSHLLDLAGDLDRDHLVLTHDHLIGDRVDDVGAADSTADGVRGAVLHLFRTVQHTAGHAACRAAILHGDNHILADVRQFAGQVSGVGRLERRVGQSLAGPVRGAEVLKHAQPFAEVRLNRRFDDLAARLGHQSPHAGELTDLFDAAPGTRIRHQIDRVDVATLFADVAFEFRHHRLGDLFPGVRPSVEDLLVAFLVGDDAAVKQLLLLEDLGLGRADHLLLVGSGHQVAGGERQTAVGRLVEAELLHV